MKIPTNSKILFLCGITAALALSFQACKKRADTSSDLKVLAVVGDREILVADLEAEIARRTAARRPVPTAVDLLAELVEREVLVQKALAAGIGDDPELRRSYQNLLIGTYKERTLNSRIEAVEVAEEAVLARYQANQDRYTKPARRHLAILHIASGSRSSAEQRELMRERAEAARAMAIEAENGGFKAAAVKYSDHQASRYKGGDLGWVERGRGHAQLSDQVLEAGFALDPAADGAISEIVETVDGFTIVKLLDAQPPSLVPIDQVATAIRADLVRERRASITEEFARAERASLVVEVFADRLGQLTISDRVAQRAEPKPPEL